MSSRSVDEEAPRAAGPAAHRLEPQAAGLLVLTMALISAWGLIMQRFADGSDIYATLGPTMLVLKTFLNAQVIAERLTERCEHFGAPRDALPCANA
jgi:hypothetical protein